MVENIVQLPEVQANRMLSENSKRLIMQSIRSTLESMSYDEVRGMNWCNILETSKDQTHQRVKAA